MAFPDGILYTIMQNFTSAIPTYNIYQYYQCSVVFDLKTAIANEDFRPVDLDLIFNEESSNTLSVSVPILNDICLEEGGEDFSVVATSDMDCVEIIGGYVNITIEDNDSELLIAIFPLTSISIFPCPQGPRSHLTNLTTKLAKKKFLLVFVYC